MAYAKMPNKYTLESDLQARLDGTICMYKEYPYVVKYGPGRRFSLYDTVDLSKKHLIMIDDPDFDISSPELGYFNIEPDRERTSLSEKNSVMYISRPPARLYKQGLSCGNLCYSEIDGKETYSNVQNIASFRQGLVDIYPSLHEALEFLPIIGPQRSGGIAVSKDVAVSRIESGLVLVWLRTKNVGWITPRTAIIEVRDCEFSWIYKTILRNLGWRVN